MAQCGFIQRDPAELKEGQSGSLSRVSPQFEAVEQVKGVVWRIPEREGHSHHPPFTHLHRRSPGSGSRQGRRARGGVRDGSAAQAH